MPYQLGYSPIWWALLDSNQGTPKRPDLQSGGFSQLTQRPIYKRLSLTTPRVLYTKWYMENLHTTRYSICKGTLRVRPAGAPSQNRTGMDSRPWDFKSHASACSAKGAYAPRFFHVRCAALTDGCLANHNLVHKERFELSNTGF